MAHKVEADVPKIPISNADWKIVVTKGGKKFGTLKISKGSVGWVKKDHSKVLSKTWDELAEFFTAQK